MVRRLETKMSFVHMRRDESLIGSKVQKQDSDWMSVGWDRAMARRITNWQVGLKSEDEL